MRIRVGARVAVRVRAEVGVWVGARTLLVEGHRVPTLTLTYPCP